LQAVVLPIQIIEILISIDGMHSLGFFELCQGRSDLWQ
jgi:hypothetical protein